MLYGHLKSVFTHLPGRKFLQKHCPLTVTKHPPYLQAILSPVPSLCYRQTFFFLNFSIFSGPPHPSPAAFWGFHSELFASSAHYSYGDPSQPRLHHDSRLFKTFQGYFMALRLIESKHHQRIYKVLFHHLGLPIFLAPFLSIPPAVTKPRPPLDIANSFLWACHSSCFLGLSFTLFCLFVWNTLPSHHLPSPLKPSLNPRTGLGGPALCSHVAPASLCGI